MKDEILKNLIERLENLKTLANSYDEEFGIEQAISEAYKMLDE